MSVETQEQELTPAAQRILTAASELFYRQGIRAVGVDLIAREADVTKKTIYDRFGSKDVLVKVYLETLDEAWHQLIRERVEQSDLTPSNRILAMFDIMEDEVRARGCAFINAHAELTEPDHPALEVARQQKSWIRDYFTSLARDAGVTDPETLGRQLMILHEGAYVAYAMAGEQDAARDARKAAETLLAAQSQSEDTMPGD